MSRPTVTLALPVLNEEEHIGACLRSLDAQGYDRIVEILVVDGGSTDHTRELAAVHPRVRVLDNPRRIQAAALNVALAEARGEVVVRIDGHCEIESDYVERAVDALERTGAAMVGGAMRPVASGWLGTGIAAAMTSPLGAGPARFHVGGEAGWVDTVYLGAYRTALAREVGEYAEDVGVNEDAEFAYRMAPHGGIWFDPSIRSTYVPRSSVPALVRQFYRYGRSRAATVRRYPGSLALRQLAAPGLVLGLCSPWRRTVAKVYAIAWAGAVAHRASRQPEATAGFAVALPAMHASWGVGFLRGMARSITRG